MAIVVGGMIAAMTLLVLYSRRVFEENRTRVTRRYSASAQAAAATGELEWRTLVDPTAAANRARASAPFAYAYSRAMADDSFVA